METPGQANGAQVWWRGPFPYVLVALIAAVLGGLSFYASLNTSDTFFLSRYGIDSFTFAEWCAGGFILALVLSASPAVRGWSHQGVSAAWRWFSLGTMPGRQYAAKDLPPAIWPILAGCRLYLAIVVLGTHLLMFGPEPKWLDWMRRQSGNDAVILFLLISGFSIGHSCVSKPEGFYWRRVIRIAPVYWTALLLATIPYLLGGAERHAVQGPFILHAVPLRVWLLHLVPIETVYPAVIPTIAVIWSLALEEFCYLLAPVFRRVPAWALGLLISMSIGLYLNWDAAGEVTRHHWTTAAAFTFGSILLFSWPWLIGFLIYRHYSKVWANLLVFMPAVAIYKNDWYDSALIGSGPYMALAFGSVFIASRYLPALADWLKKSLHWCGEISYPLYLVHFASIWSLYLLGLKNTALLPLGALITAMAMYYAVDKPIRYSKRFELLRTPFRLQISPFRRLIHRRERSIPNLPLTDAQSAGTTARSK